MSLPVTLRARRAGEEIVEQIALTLQLVVDGADRDRAGDLAGGVSPHSVTDDEEGELLVDEEVVLVVVTDLSYVGGGVETNRVRLGHGRGVLHSRPGPMMPEALALSYSSSLFVFASFDSASLVSLFVSPRRPRARVFL
jgi:hypothetical protein